VNGTRLNVYFSERARAGSVYVADALLDEFDRHGVLASALLRGVDGFGHHHHLHTDRLLSSSENLPALATAIDAPDRIQALLPEVQALTGHGGRITLDPVRLVDGPDPGAEDQIFKLTLLGGRSVRRRGDTGYVDAVAQLASGGASAASVLLAVDGTLHGQRHRARWFARNANVPLMLLAIVPGELLATLSGELASLVDDPVLAVEPTRICKLDGEVRAEPAGGAAQQLHRVTVHIDEGARQGRHPVHAELIRRLRLADAAGLTMLRGVRGFYGGREPFADRFLALRRNVPVVVTVIDSAEQIRGWWPIVDALTDEHGLVTSEPVRSQFTPVA
jgi:PII-like signaling protein